MTEEEDYTENLSAGPASSIQAIDRGTVHRICSGQVVLNLATAIKELVENSLDAGATHIEIRLKEYGSELVEVSDNGEGVEEKNFKGLTLKHHTSKLKDFSDLVNVDTFGFRGEALSSLCALSDVSITTCHKTASVGTRLEYDHHGNIQQQSPCPRQHGTTVCLQQLFSTLPVRHKEFQRNLKKEFSKMVQVLTAYCLISTGIRISCTNQIGKGKKNILVSTNGSPTMKDNITSIFGAKQLQTILELHQKSPSEDVCGEYNLNNNQSEIFKIRGYVSSSEHGKGRSSTDRQFIFINKRPCDHVKVARLVNDVYHINNRHQYPFLILDIAINKECVDVNVTPDKRQIFMQNEKLLFATIKTSLLALFEPQANMYQINQPVTQLPSSLTASFARSDKSPSQQNSSLSRSFSTPSPAQFRSGHSSSQEQGTKISLTSALSSMKRSFSSSFCKESGDTTPELDRNKQRRLDNFFTISPPSVTSPNRLSISNQSVTQRESISIDSIDLIKPNHSLQQETLSQSSTTDSGLSSGSGSQEETCEPRISNEQGNEDCKEETKTPSHNVTEQEYKKSKTNSILSDVDYTKESLDNGIQLCTSSLSVRVITKESEKCVSEKNVTSECESPGDIEMPISLSKLESEASPQVTFTEIDVKEHIEKKTIVLPFSLDKLKTRLKMQQKHDIRRRERSNMFHAKISPTDNQAAEDELKKVISKESFSQMNILGQFNLGFIIARLKQDLFIIDQHATDEKYNFEMLQRHTTIQSQKLIQPQNLELTAVNENILMDNIEIFQKNGFDFIIDEEARPTQRVKLVSMPVSRNWVFGKDDIEELIFMLSDSPGMLCRPSRVRDMFASRACRKSVMVGTALNSGEMKKVVGHMGEIEHPWNCPHGRPTMRHLINLDMLADSETSTGHSSSVT